MQPGLDVQIKGGTLLIEAFGTVGCVTHTLSVLQLVTAAPTCLAQDVPHLWHLPCGTAPARRQGGALDAAEAQQHQNDLHIYLFCS